MSSSLHTRIKLAIDKTSQLIGRGTDPTVALKKVAEDMSLNNHLIHRAGEAVNVALTYNHFKSAEDRSTNFPIVDIPKVVADVFGEAQDRSLQKKSEWFPRIYELTLDFDRHTQKDRMAAVTKIASTVTKDKVVPEKFAAEKAFCVLQDLRSAARNAEVKVVKTKNAMDALFLNISSGFKKAAGYRTTFAEFENQVLSKHAAEAKPMVDLIHDYSGVKEQRGSHDGGYVFYDQCKEANAFDKLVEATKNYKTAMEEARNADAQLKAAEFVIDSIYKKQPNTDRPVDKVAEAKDRLVDELEKMAAEDDSVDEETELTKYAFDFLQSILGKFKDTRPTPSKAPFSDSADNVERELLLQELMFTDPVISREDPRKVVQSYEQILKLAPHVVLQKEVLRAQLRIMLSSQALDPFGAKALIETNMDFLKNQQMLHPMRGGGGEDK